jgi:hypothetical protein
MTSRMSPSLIHTLVFLLLLSALLPAAMGQANVMGVWSTAPNLMPINPVHVALLPNGKILVVAGSGNCPPSQTGCPPAGGPWGPSTGSGALLWDPGTENYTQWFTIYSTPVGGFTGWDFFCNGMVLLKDGRALIDGGTIQYDPFYGQPQAVVFDPATNTFANVQNMAHGRWYPTVVTLGDGRVMTFSGLNETGATNPAVEFYTVGSGWSTQYIAPWTPDLYPRLHLLPNGKVFYSGAGTLSKLFDPSTTTWNTNVATTIYGNMRTYGTSVLLPLTPASNYDPQVIIMGGHNPATNTTEIIDMGASSPAWQSGPTMSEARVEMNAVILPDGKVLAVGGSVNDEDTSTASYNADLYDPVHNTFSSAGANSYTRLYHSVALLLPDATVWLAGGNPDRGSYTHQVEIYQPAYLFNSSGGLATRPTISSAPSSISYGSTFNLSTLDAPNISSVVLVRNGTVTHAFGMDQREVQLAYTVGNTSLTVTVPSNTNVLPPGYYMLFILNNSAVPVPSVASIVQVTAATGPPDFSVSATPSSQSVPPGTGTSYTVNVTPSNGYSGTVTFSVSGLPTGATSSFNPASVPGSGSSTLTVNTSGSTPTGTYTLTITATDGTLTHTAKVTLAVADFSISATPSSQTMSRNSKTTYTVAATPVGPFSSTVNLSLTGLPRRTNGSFNPASIGNSGGNSTLTISANRNAPTGTYTLTITGSGGGATHTANVTLTIQ